VVRIIKDWNLEESNIALELLKNNMIQFGEFRLKLHEKNPDAPLSPFYINLRPMRSLLDIISKVIKLYEDFIKKLELKYNCYADVPTAATPIVSILSYKTGVPMITPRGPKTHGVKGSIDGVFKSGDKVLLIDDLITKAESKLESIRILEENGLTVEDIVVLVDRQQGGKKELEKRGYKLHAVYNFSDLLKFYLDCKEISQEKYNKVKNYLNKNK